MMCYYQRELSGGRRHSGKATSDSGSRRSSAASSSAAHRVDSGGHRSAKERITSADSGGWCVYMLCVYLIVLC